jgi:thiol-disulfide isomerase/thioredoxin
MRKYFITISFALLGLNHSFAQQVICHISGTTTDAETKSVTLYDIGQHPMAGEGIAIPVEDGKFHYDLTSDYVKMMELVPDNQQKVGAEKLFIVENQNLNIKLGTYQDDVVLDGDGVETMMMNRCNAEIDAVYNPKKLAITASRDSLSKILRTETASLTRDEKRKYFKDLSSPQSTNPHAAKSRELNDASLNLIKQMLLAKIDWLKDNPCIYGLFNTYYNTLSLKREELQEVADYNIEVYDRVYSDRYVGHPYHEKINIGLIANQLQPGNKYIDYDLRYTDGSLRKVSSLFTEKLIYIDFWSSMCGLCRRDSQLVVPIYEKYNGRGFQVIGIARELNAEAMSKAVESDGYTWPNFLELNDENGIWAKNNIDESLGGGYLIDENGYIIAVKPTPEDLERILIERLGE